jgi:signal transduction histidine kinase
MKKLSRYELTVGEYAKAALFISSAWLIPSIAFTAHADATFGRRLVAIPIGAALFIIANLVIIAEALITQKLLQIRSKPFILPTAVVSLHAFIAGAVAGAITHPIRNWPEEDRLTWPMRSLHDGLFAMAWYPITLITLSRLTSLRRKRRLVQAEIESLVHIEESASGVLDQIRITFESSIRNSLKVTALQAQQKLALAFSKEGEISPQLPELIRDIAAIDMRELSHAMISSDLKPVLPVASADRARIKFQAFRSTILSSLEDFALRDKLWILAVLMLGTFFQNIIGSLPLGITIEIVLSHAAGVILILAIFRAIYTKYHQHLLWLVAANVISLIAFNDLLISSFRSKVGDVLPESFWIHRHFLIAIVTIFSILARFLFLFVLNQSKAKYEALNYEMARRKAEHDIHHGEYALLAYKWAKHIHGRVQSQLISAAERLERSRISGDLQGFNEALIDVRDLLTSADQGIEDERRSLHEELEHRSALWHGLVDIKGAIDPQIPQPAPSLVRIIGEVTEEAFANALRHGKASEISYEITLVDGQDIKVIVSDNGVGPLPKSKAPAGLGTKLYARASQSRYLLRRDYENQRTILEIFFPMNGSNTSLA